MIFSIISQQYIIRKTFYADLDFIQNRNNKFLSSIMLLLLSYCSVFKVQTWKFLPRRSRKWSFLCLLSCSQESKWWAWEDSNLRPHAYQACALTTWATSPFDFRRPVVVSVFRRPVVEMRRIELLTPCLQGRCSPSWATPPYFNLSIDAGTSELFLLFSTFEGTQSFDCTL